MFILSLLSDPIKALGFILGLLIAITIHEFMHGFVADFLGDPTARYQGRLSLNPAKHLDPFGTLLLLLVGFGWGKPVPINPSNFKNPRLGELLTSLSGPLSNFVMAFIFALPLRFLPESSLTPFFSIIIYINLILCAFNILPIPPLDGSKILWAVFPQIDIVAFEKIGVPILFGLVFLSYLTNYPIFGAIILPVVSFLAKIIGAGGIF
jgi:Zn-dependent protease